MLLDMNVASEMQDRIKEATDQAKNKARSGKEMVARRNQRRSQRQVLSDTDGIDMLKSIGVAFEKQ